MFDSICRDLLHAARSLIRARAFTFVCVVSLGLGMAPVVAIPHVTRLLTLPPTGLNTDGLVEVVTTQAGAREATAAWSYPDYADLRAAATGARLIGWIFGRSKDDRRDLRALFVSPDYFEVMGVPLFQIGRAHV